MTYVTINYSIEEDFITWKEKFWSSVCEQFGLQTGEDVSVRQYELIVHEDLPKEKIFQGEAARLNSFINQKP
jgi:NADPH-ferrihemoprotein reductase